MGRVTPRAGRLAEALRAARAAAEAAVNRDDDDGGSANLDTAFLYATRGLRETTVRQAAEAAGVHLGPRQRGRWWNGWMVHVGAGQGAMRTRSAVAAAEALVEAGEEATVYWQVD